MTRAKPDRYAQIVMLVWLAAGVILLTTLFRAMSAAGLLSLVTPVSPGNCRDIALSGPGDLAYEAKSRTLFIAVSRQGAPGKNDGLYALPLGATTPVKLAGTPPDFHPAGLSIGYDSTGVPTLMAVDRHQNGSVGVDIFTLNFDAIGAKLAFQSAIQGGLAKRADGIAAVGSSRFYLAANPAKSDLMVWADRYLLLGRADLLFFNGMLFREAVSGLSDPSAVAQSVDGRYLYVSSRNQRRLLIFSREPYGGSLTELDSLDLPLRPERISVDAGGALWIAGPVRLPELSGASKVVRVFIGPDGKAQQKPDTVYADDGQGINAASAAVKAENHLFIGSARDGKLLDCAIK